MKLSPPQICRFSVVFMALMAVSAISTEPKCEFKAIFNFGDSNSDTGGFWAAFPAPYPPNGMTFFRKPSGRACDGRLILDFLAEALGLPFISPYLKSIGSDFRHGVNYATLASTVLLPNTSLFVSGLSPFSLAIQLNQMKQFKDLVHEHQFSGSSTHLPQPDIFAKSLYTFYIGQNDFTSNLAAIGIAGVEQYLPQVISQIADTIKGLHELGGRTFLVLNLAPVGCYPALLVELKKNSSDIDEFGCLVSYNKAVMDYNSMLKKELSKTRKLLPDASVIYVNTHDVLLELFQHPTLHGLKYSTKACCGYGGGVYNFDPKIFCGNKRVVEGRNVTAEACSDPQNYVSWDGVHSTEAANKIVTKAILKGQYFDPPFPIGNFCDLQPIG